MINKKAEKIIKDKALMEAINKAWGENEGYMGEQAALCVACESHGVDTEWFYDHIDLIAQ